MKETLRTEILDWLMPWFILGQPTAYSLISWKDGILSNNMPNASLKLPVFFSNWYQVYAVQLLTMTRFQGRAKSRIYCYQRLRIKTINLFCYLMTVQWTDMSYLSGSDLADDGKKERENEDFIDWEANTRPLISPHTHYCHYHTIGAGKLIMSGSPFVCSRSLSHSLSLSLSLAFFPAHVYVWIFQN